MMLPKSALQTKAFFGQKADYRNWRLSKLTFAIASAHSSRRASDCGQRGLNIEYERSIICEMTVGVCARLAR